MLVFRVTWTGFHGHVMLTRQRTKTDRSCPPAGNYELAVETCFKANRLADALLIANIFNRWDRVAKGCSPAWDDRSACALSSSCC